MAKYTQWLTHKGTKVLLVNIAKQDEAGTIAAYEEMKQELLKDRTSPPVLIDLSNTPMTTATHNKAKQVAADTKAAGIPDGPTVVVGLNKLQKAVAQLLGRGVHLADSIEEAKDWLAKEENKRRKR